MGYIFQEESTGQGGNQSKLQRSEMTMVGRVYSIPFIHVSNGLSIFRRIQTLTGHYGLLPAGTNMMCCNVYASHVYESYMSYIRRQHFLEALGETVQAAGQCLGQ